MKVSNKTPINDGAALLVGSKKKSSVDGIPMEASDLMMISAQSRDDIDVLNEEIEISVERHKSLVNADRDAASETQVGAENQQSPDVVLDMMAPAALSRSGSAMSSASCKQSKSFQEAPQMKPVPLFRSRTAAPQKDKKSSPVIQDIAAPASLSRCRTATPQISSDKSTPTFSDMMKLVALSRAKSIKLTALPKVAEPETIEEVETIEEEEVAEPEEMEEVATTIVEEVSSKEEEEEPTVSAVSSPQISSELTASPGAEVAAYEEAPAADSAPAATASAVKDPTVEALAANEVAPDEEFATVELVEKVVEDVEQVAVELEPEEEFAEVIEVPSVTEDRVSKSSLKKSKWSKMKGFLAKK